MGALRLIALSAVLALTSCGAMRFLFASDDGKPSRAVQAATIVAQNGTDPVKWISWLAGAGAIATAGGGYAAGRYHGRERRSGKDRRVAGDI